MKYLGGKDKLSKKIADVICSYDSRHYLEPFVGGGSVLCEVSKRNKFDVLFAGDIHLDLIMLWRALQSGWIPPEIVSEEQYRELKQSQEPSAVRAFVGFGCSFGGKWFGGYARGMGTKGPRNYANEARSNLLRKSELIKDVGFDCKSYDQWTVPEGSVIYCDPPYKNTTKYSMEFDSDRFWNWAKKMSEKNIVLVSEFSAADGWKTVMSINRKTSVAIGNGNCVSDNLYIAA